MTSGERMVWCATFACVYEQATEMSRRGKTTVVDQPAWRQQQAVTAAEHACVAAMELRGLAPALGVAFGEDSDELQLFQQAMLYEGKRV